MNSLPQNPIENKVVNGGFCRIFRTIGCIGDSLASGEHESMINGTKKYHDCYEYSWGQFIARATGSTVYNFSSGGLSTETFLENKERLGFTDPDKKCQAYIIALGVNDAIANMPTGSADDVHPENPEMNSATYAGFYGKIISEIKKIQPKARIFMLTSPRMGSPDWDRQIKYNEQQEILYKLTDIFNFTYVIDIRKYVPELSDDFCNRYWIGGHLNAMGYIVTAEWVMSYIDYIIQNNYSDFSQVAFIGTDFYNENYK